MNFRDLFKPRWQHGDRQTRLKAFARITDTRTLRRIAGESGDGQLRLAAACRLNDKRLIKSIARSAAEETVRLKAAIAAGDQSCLAAIALNDWAINRGLKAVEMISNKLLLRRVAQSAKQDAIRLAAAVKLESPEMLRKVARSSNHIEIHWQVAKRLNDPKLMAEVALFKPGNPNMAPLRRKAKSALLAYLERCRMENDHPALLHFMKSVPHLTYQLEAFVRLPAPAVTLAVLRFLTRQDFRYVPQALLEKVLAQIMLAGWLLWPAYQYQSCIHCHGSGQLSLKCICANNTWGDRDVFPCPECDGKGKNLFKWVTCKNKKGEQVVFRFPQQP